MCRLIHVAQDRARYLIRFGFSLASSQLCFPPCSELLTVSWWFSLFIAQSFQTYLFYRVKCRSKPTSLESGTSLPQRTSTSTSRRSESDGPSELSPPRPSQLSSSPSQETNGPWTLTLPSRTTPSSGNSETSSTRRPLMVVTYVWNFSACVHNSNFRCRPSSLLKTTVLSRTRLERMAARTLASRDTSRTESSTSSATATTSSALVSTRRPKLAVDSLNM